MALLSIANLEYRIGERVLLDGASLTLNAGDHVGLVGRNGCGKTTLMKLIAGLSAHGPDAGQVQISRDATVGYLTQDPDLDLDQTLRHEAGSAFAELTRLHDELDKVAHAMAEVTDGAGETMQRLLRRYEQLEHRMQQAGGYAVDHLIEATLHGVGLDDSTFNVKVRDLSGGQKGRLALAKLLLSKPDVLLLDEPTNHLDIAGREWLENFLNQFPGAVILISHDRWLLNRTVSRIYELEAGQLVEYPGNYDKFRQLRAERILAQHRAFEKQQTKIRHEQAFIDRYRAGQRAKQAQGREKRLARFKRDEGLERPVELDEVNIRFAPIQRAGDQIVVAVQVSKSYGQKVLFRDVTLTIQRGDRIGVIGPNGAGKTTLTRCLLGEQDADPDPRTVIRIGSSVDIGHYHQTHEGLNTQLTVVDYLRLKVPDQLEQSARDLAGAFLFSGGDQDKPLSALSGGERSRTVLAGLVVSGHNVLVLDEPTNHLDIPSCERLEESLLRFNRAEKRYSKEGANKIHPGTLILVTHDRWLLDRLVDQLLVFDGSGRVTHFLGTYSDYLAEQARQQTVAEPKPEKPKPEKPKPAPKSKPTRPSKGGGGGGGGLGRMSQEKLEAEIERLETELHRIDFDLASPAVFSDGDKVRQLKAEREKLESELKPLEREWGRRAE
ncbi:MAG: ABC-F family ATP-binding cassette domain-containing protein [Phycisphaeraceae bacterium]|nr:ABC-F family ATP-binding cassette domain-containing protein [Phycisphaeraceae bacterium]